MLFSKECRNANYIYSEGIHMYKLCIILAVIILVSITMAPAQAQTGKILVAYFSHTQTTEKVALEIQRKTGADLFRIETVQTYPAEHRQTVALAEKENEANARPTLAATVENMDSYDVIFLGYPIWVYTLPMPLFTFLDSYDLSGKTVIPFCTHGGSRLSGTESVIRKIQPNTNVLEGLAVHRNIILNNPDTGAQKPVAEWLAKLGF